MWKASGHDSVPLMLVTTWRYLYGSLPTARHSCVAFDIGQNQYMFNSVDVLAGGFLSTNIFTAA